jgi:hypothetical protein
LLPNWAGRTFVRFYYEYSPPVADYIAGHDSIRTMIRWMLLPLVGISWVILKIGPLYSLVVGIVLCLALSYFLKFFRNVECGIKQRNKGTKATR